MLFILYKDLTSLENTSNKWLVIKAAILLSSLATPILKTCVLLTLLLSLAIGYFYSYYYVTPMYQSFATVVLVQNENLVGAPFVGIPKRRDTTVPFCYIIGKFSYAPVSLYN